MAVAFASALASCAALASGTYNYHKSDGTNVWIGAASGGSMKELSNWKALVGGAEHTDEAEAARWYRKAAAQGLAEAKAKLRKLAK